MIPLIPCRARNLRNIYGAAGNQGNMGLEKRRNLLKIDIRLRTNMTKGPGDEVRVISK